MSTLFISDLHLSEERPHIIELFIEFLQTRARDASALYILGDLFEVWIGDDYVPRELQHVIAALKDYSAANHELYVMRGNRDFLMGEQFEVMTGCRLLPDPWRIDLNGTKTLLSHGDELCTDDVEYMKFRHQVRQPAWQQAFLDKSVEQRLEFAREAREQSRAHTGRSAMEIMDVNQSAVEQCLSQHQVTQLIHGHTHRPHIHHFTIDDIPMTRMVLGDWYEDGSVLECTASGCQLQNLPLR